MKLLYNLLLLLLILRDRLFVDTIHAILIVILVFEAQPYRLMFFLYSHSTNKAARRIIALRLKCEIFSLAIQFVHSGVNA